MAKDNAIDFTLKNIDGEEIKLSNYKGKIIILNFLQLGVLLVRLNFQGLFNWWMNIRMIVM
ncbi:redoxin domain-containing protein [Caloramator sp. mosi_1]|nr:redoxin domain-containing protein [Caloramator sp. mosi_1]WDC85075.1 redoxin domain-containing protein [Caloramator sp. mosi_1]